MPEGDTIFRAARSLSTVLTGRTVISASAPRGGLDASALVGREILGCEPHGKVLNVRFAGGLVLRTHMKMTGSWHVYPRGRPWRSSIGLANVVLDVGEHVAVLFHAPTCVLERERSEAHREAMAMLGPDVLAADFDEDAALANLRDRAEMPIGEALLDQGALAGIGNIYKSETLFAERANPFAPVAAYDDEKLRAIVRTARRLMKRNLDNVSRVTTAGNAPGRVWVYRRQRKACARCGRPIAMRRQGPQARSTYFCPRCQAQPAA